MKKTVRTGRTLVFNSKTKFKNYLKKLEIMPTQYNRPVSESHIASMQRSVAMLGVQRAVVVVITKAFNGKETRYIADGQHITQGIINIPHKDLHGHFAVFESHIDNAEDIIPFVSVMNSTAKNWSLKEYLHAWCTHGKEDYIYLRKKVNETGYSLNGLIEAFQGRRGFGNKTFKDGKFHAQKKKGLETLKNYDLACEFGLKKGNSSFLAFVRFLIDNQAKLDMGEVLQTIGNNKDLFSGKGNREYYLNLLRGLCLNK